jgi:hypothetical protein
MADFKYNNIHMVAGFIRGIDGFIFGDRGGIHGVQRVSTGIYIVTFSFTFSNRPTVVATQCFPGGIDMNNNGGSTLDNAIVVSITNTQVKIKTGDSNGNSSDRDFAFMAMEVDLS